jgi:NTE family protein
MAGLVAADQPMEWAREICRRSFQVNPTGDFNWLPLLSLISGRRLARILGQSLTELLGLAADIEDLRKNHYCIASNHSQALEQALRNGSLHKALRASTAIPGALPPTILDGDLLRDGGAFSNFPVDVMRNLLGVGTVIGVDLSYVTVLYSMPRQRHARALTDLYFNPPLDRVGLLDWKRFDQIVQQGCAHAREVLAAHEPYRP